MPAFKTHLTGILNGLAKTRFGMIKAIVILTDGQKILGAAVLTHVVLGTLTRQTVMDLTAIF